MRWIRLRFFTRHSSLYMSPAISIQVQHFLRKFVFLSSINSHNPTQFEFTDIMIHVFPINNALIILTMTDDYRNTLMSQTGIKKQV